MKSDRRNKQSGSRKDQKLRFQSEALLQQAIAGLLTRMDDVTGVQILQGSHELGKDLVFYIRGGFSESLLCACVVKNTKITGDVSSSHGARTVFLQAQQAFDTPHIDENGKDISVERVYVVTPFDLLPATRESIKGKLKERSGQVVFIGGATLFDLFKKHWPDYLADHAAIIESHLSRTRQKIDEANPIPEIAIQYDLGAVSTNIQKVYVPQAFYRDVYSYRIGPLLTATLNNAQRLYQQFTREELNEFLAPFNRLKEGFDYLHEWGYYLRTSISDIDDITVNIREFINGIETDWKERLDKILKEQKRNTGATTSLADQLKLAVVRPSASIGNTFKWVKMYELICNKRREAIAYLADTLSQLESFVSSYNPDGLSALSDEVFLSSCRLDDCAYSAPGGLFESYNKLRANFPKDLLSKWNGHIMIVGAPGYGKTSFCRWHALQDTERFASGTSNLLPVYIPLYSLARRELLTFEETFLETLGMSALLTASAKQLRSKNLRIRLYLDGLDEIPSSNQRQKVIHLARQGVSNSNKYQVILTSRDYVYGSWLDWIPRVSLGGFEDVDIKELVDKWLGKDSNEVNSLYEQLRSAPALSYLMRTPLLATLIILVFRQTGRLPENKTRLYEIFVGLLSGGWDIAKGVLRKSEFGQHMKVLVLQSIAAGLHEKRRKEFLDIDIKETMETSLLKRIVQNWENLRDELIEDGLITRSGDNLQFSHLSFQEFLTARDFIGDPQPLRIANALDSILIGDNWWKEAWSFYVGLSGKPRELVNWVINKMTRTPHTQYKTTPQTHVDDIFKAILESFPGFPLDEMARGHLEHIGYSLDIQRLRSLD
jgi:hypothetical protein